jgi:hypothetical protein
MNGFWFRRVYLTYDYKYDDAISARVRLETATPGDFSNRVAMITYIKDAFLKWQSGAQAVLVGISPAPSLPSVEEIWGYRSLEKTASELQRLVTSRDMGVAATGTLGAGKTFGYHAMVGNGNGLETETNSKKKGMLSLRLRPNEHIVIEGYGDYEDRTNDADRTSAAGLVGYQSPKFRAGAQYAWQRRNTIGDDVELNIVSLFASAAVSEKVWLVGRVDLNMDANPEGNKIAYIPFDPTASNTFVLAALDYHLRDNISVMPNVEAVIYDEPGAGGDAPDSDFIPRLTFFWKF